MRPIELALVHERADRYGEYGHNERGHGGLHLHQRNVADHHVNDGALRGHVAQIGLGGEARRQAHVQVAFQSEQRRHQNEQLRHVREDLPALLVGELVGEDDREKNEKKNGLIKRKILGRQISLRAGEWGHG